MENELRTGAMAVSGGEVLDVLGALVPVFRLLTMHSGKGTDGPGRRIRWCQRSYNKFIIRVVSQVRTRGRTKSGP